MCETVLLAISTFKNTENSIFLCIPDHEDFQTAANIVNLPFLMKDRGW